MLEDIWGEDGVIKGVCHIRSPYLLSIILSIFDRETIDYLRPNGFDLSVTESLICTHATIMSICNLRLL